MRVIFIFRSKTISFPEQVAGEGHSWSEYEMRVESALQPHSLARAVRNVNEPAEHAGEGGLLFSSDGQGIFEFKNERDLLVHHHVFDLEHSCEAAHMRAGVRRA